MQNEVEMMRVIRVPPLGKLIVEVGGRRVENLSQVDNEAIRRRLMAAVGELITFAGGYDTLVDAGVAPPAAAGEPREDTSQEPAEETMSAQQAAFLASLERELKNTVQASGLPAPVEPDLEEIVEGPPADEARPYNLVEEIDTILQKYVAADPSLSGRSVHLEQPPGSMLKIEVDGTYYEHPNEIDDQNVRIAIKMALREWESG